MCLVIGHQLVFVCNGYEVFTAFYKSDYFARNFKPHICKGQRITDLDVVCTCEFIRKPNTVRASVVFRAVHDHHRGNGVVLGYIQRYRLFGVLDANVYAKISRCAIYAVNVLDLLDIILGEAALGIKSVVGIVRIFEKAKRIGFKAFPLNIKAEKDADTDSDHNHHRNKLRFVFPRSTE